MPRKDQIHEAVKNALIKDGWTITDDPYRIHFEDVDVYADLGVVKTEVETEERHCLVIEVKSFTAKSAIHDLETALGQYIAYRTFLQVVAPEYKLYLAISDLIYRAPFQRKSFQLLIKMNDVSLIVVDVPQEEVVLWIN